MMYLGSNAVGLALKVDLGGVTKYKEVKVTPSNVTNLEVTHNIGIVPKYIEITCADNSHAKANTSFIYYGIFGNQYGVTNGVYYNQTATMQRVFTCDATYTTISAMATEHYYLSSTSAIFKYRNGAYCWDTETEYTVKIYA